LRGAEVAAERERNLAGLFGAIEDYIFVVDLDGRVLHYNSAVARSLGYGDSLLGRPLIEVHPPEFRAEAGRILAAMSAGRLATCPLPICKADGERIQVDTRAVPGTWNGQPAIFGVARDITRQLKQEAALGEAVQFSDDVMIHCRNLLIDETGVCCAGTAPVRCLRLHRVDIGSMLATDFFVGDDIARIGAAIAEAFRAGDASVEGSLKPRTGTAIPYFFTARRTTIGGRAYIGGLGMDISATKATEASLAESNGLLRAIIDTAPLRVFWKDRELRYLGCNPPFARDAGLVRPEQVVGLTDHDLGWADLAAQYQADDRRVIETGIGRAA
jgi:PAS domain S-box-containing protein